MREINKIAIPAIFANISEPLIALGDTIILGQLDNSIVATSAVANATAFYLTIVWVLAQIKSSISAIVSRSLGLDNLNDIKTLVPQTLLLTGSVGVLLYACTSPFASSIMAFYEMDGIALGYAIEYYQIRAIGFPFILIAFTVFGVFRGMQNTFWPMVIGVSGGLLNLVLDYIFVLGVDGVVSGIGVSGAAYASLIVQIYMCLFAIIMMVRKTPFGLKFGRQTNVFLKEVLDITLNLLARTIVLNITLNLANKTATGLSNAHNTAHTIAYQLWLFTAFFIDGYSNAANAIGGKLLGKGDFKAMKFMTLSILKYNVIISIVLGLFLAIVYNEISYVFNANQEINQLLTDFFWITLLMLPINAIAFSFDGLFKGLGEAKFLRNILFVSTFGGFMPVLFIGNYFGLGLKGVWLALFVWMVLRAILPWCKFNRLMNRKIKDFNR